MSESGTKAVIWRVQMTQPAVRMAFLKAMWKWKELPRRPPRGPLQHSRFSFSWHCENIHPTTYWVFVYVCKDKECVKGRLKKSILYMRAYVFQDHSPLSRREVFFNPFAKVKVPRRVNDSLGRMYCWHGPGIFGLFGLSGFGGLLSGFRFELSVLIN